MAKARFARSSPSTSVGSRVLLDRFFHEKNHVRVRAFLRTGETQSVPHSARVMPPLLQVVTSRPWLGLEAATERTNPLWAQAEAVPAISATLLGFSETSDALRAVVRPFAAAEEHLAEAHAILGGARNPNDIDTDRAGLHFREARQGFDAVDRGALTVVKNHVDKNYIAATFGEAHYGPVDAETYAALRVIKRYAEATDDWELVGRERLTRAHALMRVGREHEYAALQVLRHFATDEHTPLTEDLRVIGLGDYGNLLLNRAVRHTKAPREESIRELSELLVHQLPKLFPEQNAKVSAALRPVVARLYRTAAETCAQLDYPATALAIIKAASVLFEDEQVIAEILAKVHQHASSTPTNADRADPDLEGKVESPLIALLRHDNMMQSASPEVALWQRVRAAAAQFAADATFPDNAAYWQHVMLGSVTGALAGLEMAVAGMMHAGPDLTQSAMLGSAIGATAAVALGKGLAGIHSVSRQEAWATGYSAHSLGSMVPELAKLAATYAIFGGLDMPGPGSVVSVVSSSLVGHYTDWYNAVSDLGFATGTNQWWNQWATTSPFAEVIDNVLGFGPRLWDVFDAQRVPEWWRSFPMNTPMDLAGDVVKIGAYGCGTYALGSLFGLRKYMLPGVEALGRLPHQLTLGLHQLHAWPSNWIAPMIGRSSVEAAMVLGAAVATGLGMIASGSHPIDPWYIIPASWAIWYRFYLSGGGDPRILKREVFQDIDWAKLMTAGAVHLLYIAPGKALSPSVTIHPHADLWQRFGESVQAHYGMIGLLALFGIPHALMTGMNMQQVLRAKYAKGLVYESPSNGARLLLGWENWQGIVVGGLGVKEVLMGPATSRSINEAGGSRVQQDAFRKNIELYLQGRATDEAFDGALTIARPDDIAKRMYDARERAMKLYTETEAAIREGAVPDVYRFLLLDPLKSENIGTEEDNVRRYATTRLRSFTDLYWLEDFYRQRIGGPPMAQGYQGLVYATLTEPRMDPQSIDDYLENHLSLILMDADPTTVSVRYNLLITTLRAAAEPAFGAQIRAFFATETGAALLEHYLSLETKAWAREELRGFLTIPLESGLKRWWDLPSFGRFFRRFSRQSAHARLYDASALAGQRWSFFSPLTESSVFGNGAPLVALLASIVRGVPARSTWADPSFYYGTVYRKLMEPVSEHGTPSAQHIAREIQPALQAIQDILEGHMGDLRHDVRHNLLLCVLMARVGPYDAAIQDFIDRNWHLIKTYDFPDSLLQQMSTANLDMLPGSLHTRRERRRAMELFREHLRDSTVSPDGAIHNQGPRVEFEEDAQGGLGHPSGGREIFSLAALQSLGAVGEEASRVPQ